MKKKIDSLDGFAKAIFEDEELFSGLCNLVGAMFELTNARGKTTDELLEKIYRFKNDS